MKKLIGKILIKNNSGKKINLKIVKKYDKVFVNLKKHDTGEKKISTDRIRKYFKSIQ